MANLSSVTQGYTSQQCSHPGAKCDVVLGREGQRDTNLEEGEESVGTSVYWCTHMRAKLFDRELVCV